MGTYTKKIMNFWHRSFRVIAWSLAAFPMGGYAATDIDFAKQELSREARSHLSHLSGGQRQTVNLLDRYQRQKQAQLRAKQQAVPTTSKVADNAQGTAQPEGNNPASSPVEDFLVSYSLSKKDCVLMLATLSRAKPDKGVILQAQQQLVELGYGLEKIDDILGSETKTKLMQFCERGRFALSGELLDMLQNHAIIHRAYPDWVQILASGDFGRWAVKQSDREAIGKTRQLGDAKEVIALLDRYKEGKAAVVWTDDFQVSYSLTKDDLKQLQSTNGIFKLVEKLQGASYAGKKEFDAALETAFKGVANPERYMQLVQKYAEPQIGLMLTEESFKNLKVKNVPDYILQPMQSLKGLNYPGIEINAAVENIANTLVDKAEEYSPEDIVEMAEILPSGARITDATLKKFAEAQEKDDPLAEVVLQQLQKMKKVEYQSSKTLTSALKNVLKQVVDEINNSVPIIIGETEEITGYSLSVASMQEINEQLKEYIVPEIYLEILANLQDVDYPEPELFWLAAKSKMHLERSNNVFRKPIFEVIEKLRANRVDKVLLGKLREEKLPPAILAQLGTLQERKFDDTKALEKEIIKMFAQLYEQFEPFRPLVTAQARKKHPYDKTKNILWSGESCNCVRDNLAGVVYGFYPFWKAGEKQTIDFSVLTRIGYYGLGFDDKGNIVDANRWSNLDTGFIREARAYDTKVDLVISRNDWSAWSLSSAEEKSAIFENLAMNIAGLVDIPLTNFTSRAKPIVSLGASQPQIMGDGVTLYFAGYPQDRESVDAFQLFIRTLKDIFKAQKRKYSVNIMFRSSEMGKGIYDYYKLKEIMDTLESGGKDMDSLFIVLLEEPTALDKKQLRINVENGMRAKDRVRMLRNIVITRSFDKNDAFQMSDDITYAKDNFGGVGFWPQPFSVAGHVADNGISEALNENYLNNVDVESSMKSTVCRFICPNRWVFRIAWEIFALVLLVGFILYLRKCEFRAFLEKHFTYVIVGAVAPVFLLSMALMYCDPFLAELSRGHGLLMIVVVAIIIYSIWNHWDKKKKINLP